MSDYLVTGCAGFIGSRVARLLLDQGHQVTGIDDLSDGYDPRLKRWRLEHLTDFDAFSFHQADVRELNALAPLFEEGFNAVVSLAARAGVRQSVENPWIYAETNYIGTLNLLELCKVHGVEKFILASTSSVYGDDTPPPFSEDAPTNMPISPYASSKKAAETLAYTYSHLFGIDTTVLRFFTVYGPAGRPDMSIFRFVRCVSEGLPISLFGDGGERDYTHVDDVARGVVASLKPLGYEIINLGGDRPVKITFVISLVEKALGKTAVVNRMPRHATDVDSTWADISKARELLGWRPKISLEEGVIGAVQWYLENRHWAKDILT